MRNRLARKRARQGFRGAAGLTVPERLLLFCLASDTDWQAANITHATGQQMRTSHELGAPPREGEVYARLLEKLEPARPDAAAPDLGAWVQSRVRRPG